MTTPASRRRTASTPKKAAARVKTRGLRGSQTNPERREQIVAAAAELFARQGYAETSLQDIMDSLGVTGAAYYYYFANKEAVLLEILDSALARVEQVLLELELDPDLSAEEKLRRTIEAHSKAIAENAQAASVLFSEVAKNNGKPFRAIHNRMRAYTDEVIDLYRQGVADGSLLDVEPRLAVYALLGMANWAFTWYDPKRHPAPDEVAKNMGDVVTRAFGQPAKRAPRKRATPGA
jgi:TetR/AcrR family transcriptional regulator, cholesterol catabolism regulator